MTLTQRLLQILPGVKVIIANPETKGPLGDSHLGEVTPPHIYTNLCCLPRVACNSVFLAC